MQNEYAPRQVEVSLLHKWHLLGQAHPIVFSDQGDYIAMSLGTTVYLYSINSGLEVGMFVHQVDVTDLTGQQQGRTLQTSPIVECMCFSPDSQYLVTSMDDKTIRLWDVRTKCVKRRFPGHTSVVHCVSISSDGKYLALGREGEDVWIWDLTAKQPVFTEIPLTATSLAFSPDSQLLAVSTPSDSIELLDTETWDSIKNLDGLPDQGRGIRICFSAAGDHLTLLSPPTVKRWRLSRVNATRQVDRRLSLSAGSLLAESTQQFEEEGWELFGRGSARDWVVSRNFHGEITVQNLADVQMQLTLTNKNEFDGHYPPWI